MKVNLVQELKTLRGTSYDVQEGEKKVPLTLGMVIAESLANDATAGKMKIWSLAYKAYLNADMDVDAADLALIKKAVEGCKSYNSLIIGQALTLLEEVK